MVCTSHGRFHIISFYRTNAASFYCLYMIISRLVYPKKLLCHNEESSAHKIINTGKVAAIFRRQVNCLVYLIVYVSLYDSWQYAVILVSGGKRESLCSGKLYAL